MLERVAGRETVSLRRIAFARIVREKRVRKYRPTAFNDTIRRAAGSSFFGRLSLLDRVFQRGLCIKLGEAWAAAAVMHAGNEKQAEEIFVLFVTAHNRPNHEFHLPPLDVVWRRPWERR